ncbi:MAG: UDP-N-acetylmuramate--L-alanine ligase [Ruminococcaceae bacterium]|nr:UDP-N-acetylmuramate--L-alanine ligase [Oscillospiraceae bacterium]
MSTPNTHLGYCEIGNIMNAAIGKNIHFIGAGGIMMSSLALLTHKLGYDVSGSDRSDGALIKKLKDAGIRISHVHEAKNMSEDCAAVVYTVAISEDNPEYVEAKKRGIPCISRADYLGYIMMGYRQRIGVAGMHGKSSCTSMCAEIFIGYGKRTGEHPTIISGAEYAAMDGAYYLGDTQNFLFEACEYMDSFLDFNPTVAVLLNADLEHIDYFKNLDQIIESFGKYANLTGEDGYAVVCADDENIMRSVQNYKGHIVTFGIDREADFQAKNIKNTCGAQEFDVCVNGEFLTRVTLPAFGRHNVLNALAAFAASYICEISVQDIVNGLASYTGAKRRMEHKGSLGGACVYDDYGHHPTEIAATLSGAREFCSGRLICAFQPHTYSRTLALIDDFESAFKCADTVIFADIYAAREQNTQNISSKMIADRLGEKGIYAGDFEAVAGAIKSIVRPEDMVIVMGAGDIYKVFGMLDLE